MTAHLPKNNCFSIYATVTVLLWCPVTNAQTDAIFDWVRVNTGGAPTAYEIELDQNRNLYTTGWFQNLADFDPGDEVYELTGHGLSDIYTQKLNSDGEFVWAGDASATGNSQWGFDVAIDASENVYTVGEFAFLIDVDPGPGTTYLQTHPLSDFPTRSTDGFVQKLDANRNLVWAFGLGGREDDRAEGVEVDALGNIYVTGTFDSIADFDPGPDTVELLGLFVGTAFVQKLNPSGELIWAVATQGNSTQRAKDIVVDPLGNVYIVGQFDFTSDFNPGSGLAEVTAAGEDDCFVLKLDGNGNFLWVRTLGGSGTDIGWAIALDHDGNVYTAGEFENTVDFDPGPGAFQLTSQGDSDAFLHKMDSSGNFLWARAFHGDAVDAVLDVQVDSDGDAYISGFFEQNIDLNPGPATSEFTSAGEFDAFLARIDADGALVWSKTLGAEGRDVAYSLVLDEDDNVFLTGQFEGAVDLDPGPGIAEHVSIGPFWDTFILKLTPITFGGAPVITSNPSPGFIEANKQLVLTAPGGNSYSWKRNGVPLSDDAPRITGTATRTLVFSPVLDSDAGVYTVTFNDGTKAVVDSDPFVLAVLPGGSLPASRPFGLLLMFAGLLGLFVYRQRRVTATRKTR